MKKKISLFVIIKKEYYIKEFFKILCEKSLRIKYKKKKVEKRKEIMCI